MVKSTNWKQGKYVHPVQIPHIRRKWTPFRRKWLDANPLCVHCGRAANHVDHIKPLKYSTATVDTVCDPFGVQSLCAPCHYRKTKIENYAQRPEHCIHGYKFDVDGNSACRDGCKPKGPKYVKSNEPPAPRSLWA